MKSICSVNGCVRGVRARSLCRAHYMQWVRLQHKNDVVATVRPYEKQKGRSCLFDGCKNNVVSRGFCNKHYQQWYTRGKDLNNLTP